MSEDPQIAGEQETERKTGQSRADRKRAKAEQRKAKEESRSTASKIFRSAFTPTAPWRSPIRTIEGSGVLFGKNGLLRSGIKQARRTCSRCSSRMQLETIIPTNDNGVVTGEPQRVLACTNCDNVEDVTEIMDASTKSMPTLKSAETQFYLFGALIFGVFGVISFFNGSLFTFLGGAVVAFLLIATALFYRYRYWQAKNGRMFEDRPPIKDWLRDEMKN